ncbi:Eukaryotic translation initiation factor isoform 4E-2 [Hibiscus syriacus]|uniref:Eukaryotic translation initiation factor isoform 4E n=1 Tax=Hibiscus syriacus TaxID=106335 RepID=A0A6A3B460_HIBSY|nr:Eukaryotic translation initiation factor isoform 4E-2 [Hibiscus syriacus]
MATEAAEEVPVPAAVAEAAATTGAEKQPHKLERKWAFWFDNQSKPKQGAAWGITLRKVYTFDTVEEFWCLYDQIFKPSKLPGNADFHLFKAGIEPKWEDPECANGGKWTVLSSPSNRRTNFENMWLETVGVLSLDMYYVQYGWYLLLFDPLVAFYGQLMALIGEQFDDSDEICGVVASVRQRQDKLALWTKTATNEAAQMGIGRKWKEIIDINDKITYSFHDDSRRERSVKRYNV